jgi:uncharacterized protein YecT (DUF1311 family)
MKNSTRLLFVWIALILPATLYAQSGGEASAEANQIYAKADKNLNAAYEHLIKSIRSSKDKATAESLIQSLRESQRAWLKFRDAQVAFVGVHADVGSAAARAVGLAAYSAELTEQRIKDLKEVPDPF